jgi:HEAT repeat protein
MRKRARIGFAVFLIAVVGAITWKVLRVREPVYQGRSLSGWLDEAEHHEVFDLLADGRIETRSAIAIRAMGPSALPTLTDMVRTMDSPLRRRWLEFAQGQSWIPIHVQSLDEIGTKTAYAFMALGPSAKPAVSTLSALLEDKDSDVREMAAYCLGKIGPAAADAVRPLEGFLDRTMNAKSQWDSKQKFMAIYALGEIGPEARSAIPRLTALSIDQVLEVRSAARAALIKITGGNLDSVIVALADTSNPTNWFEACGVVGLLGTNGTPAIAALIKALEQSDSHVQEQAIEALGRIHARPEICIPAITPFLQATNNFVRWHSLVALSAFGTNARSLMPTSDLIRSLDDMDGLVRQTATNALRYLEPEAAAKVGIQLTP